MKCLALICAFLCRHLADSFHSNSSPSCCSVSISVNSVGVGVLSSSPRMWRSRSAAGDTGNIEIFSYYKSINIQESWQSKKYHFEFGNLIRQEPWFNRASVCESYLLKTRRKIMSTVSTVWWHYPADSMHCWRYWADNHPGLSVAWPWHADNSYQFLIQIDQFMPCRMHWNIKLRLNQFCQHLNQKTK